MVDEGAEIDKKMVEAVNRCDIVVTSGGVSMGLKDLIKPYVESKGQVIFGRLNMKPGKPTTFGKIKDTLIFSLPGNPVSCFVTFNLLVLPSIKILIGQNEDEVFPLKTHVFMMPKIAKIDPERPEYHRTIAV